MAQCITRMYPGITPTLMGFETNGIMIAGYGRTTMMDDGRRGRLQLGKVHVVGLNQYNGLCFTVWTILFRFAKYKSVY